MPRKTMDIQFPAAGVVRRGALRATTQGRGPHSTPWSVNVRLEDILTKRLRGGSFTGIAAGSRPDSVYRDRAVEMDGVAVRVSRQGSQTDFDFSADVSDVARPTLFPLAEAGGTGATVVAVAPHEDSALFCFTAGETWVQLGDPLLGPRRNVSREVGIIGADAWCVGHDTLYFLSSQGLYSVGVDGGGLKPVSEDKIPDELTGVSDTACKLDYNHADRGIYITRSSGVSWFYDSARDQIWPYDRGEGDSHVLLGPFQLGQANSFGRALRLHGVIASGSDDVTWRLVTGDTAEGAAANGKAAITAELAGNSYSSYVKAEGTWSAGRAHRAYPRTRAVWCCLWLHSEGDWAFEEALLVATLSGKWR